MKTTLFHQTRMTIRQRCVQGVMAGMVGLAGMAFSAVVLADDASPAQTVVIDNFSFNPPQISVAAGSSVTWENHDDIPHTIVEDATPREFKSPPLDSGDHFTRTFLKPGTYKYFCSLHPHMQGTVIVK